MQERVVREIRMLRGVPSMFGGSEVKVFYPT
jgi:hypothetical protein